MENNVEITQVPELKLKFSELLNEAWEFAGTKLWRFLGAYLVYLVTFMLTAGIYAAISVLILFVVNLLNIPALTAILAIILVLGLLAITILISSALIAAFYKLLADTTGSLNIISAIREGKKHAKRLFPTIIILGLVTIGGYAFFFIPGIIMGVSLSMVMMVSVLEEKNIWEALVRSRDLVRGNWWKVFSQMLSMIVLAMITMLVTGGQASPVSILVAPIFYIYMYLMYKKLVEFYPHKTLPAKGDWYYKAAAVIGGIALMLGLIIGSFALSYNWPKIMEKLEQNNQSAEQKFFEERMKNFEKRDFKENYIPNQDFEQNWQDSIKNMPTY